MGSNANIVGVASIVPPVPAAQPARDNQTRQSPPDPEQARYRLVIEEGPRAGSFVYKTLDRATGEVVRQYPREEVVQMMNTPGYGAGSVIDTKA